jgi:hypothetical protein
VKSFRAKRAEQSGPTIVLTRKGHHCFGRAELGAFLLLIAAEHRGFLVECER